MTDLKSSFVYLARILTQEENKLALFIVKQNQKRRFNLKNSDLHKEIKKYRALLNYAPMGSQHIGDEGGFIQEEIKAIRNGRLKDKISIYLYWLWDTWPEIYCAFFVRVAARIKIEDAEFIRSTFPETEKWALLADSRALDRIELLADLESRFDHLLADDPDREPTHVEALHQSFVDERASGIWLLSGGPGCGKTSIMTELHQSLARHSRAVFYAFSADPAAPDGGRLEAFHEHLNGYLDLAFEKIAPEDLSGAATAWDRAWRKLQILSRAGKIGPERQLHIVVDGLDEIDARDREGAPSANPLRLPPTLPDGVYVAYSARLRDTEKSGYVTLDKVPIHDRHVSLESGEAEDLRKTAVRRYVRRICQRQDYIQQHVARQSQGPDKDAFIDTFCEKADWNFMICRCCLFESSAWRTDNPLDWLAPDLMRYYELHLTRMAKRSYYGVDGRATFCFGLGTELSRKNFIRLAAGEDQRSRAEALSALDEWISQGLIITRRSSPSSNTDWLLPYHRTYREFLADKFRELDDVIFLESFIDNLTGDDLRVTIRRVQGDVYLEWVSLLLRLCRWLGDPYRFESIVSSLELWQETLRRDRGLEIMLGAIGQISPHPEHRADFERLYEALAGQLIKWSKEKRLPSPGSEKHYDLARILEALSRPQFYQTTGNLTLLDNVVEQMGA